MPFSPTSHAPADYVCPFCVLVAGGTTSLTDQRDVVRRANGATAIMSPHGWPNNHGHVLVVSDAHHENVYDLPPSAAHAVADLVRDIAIALRTVYEGCSGISVRQNNEPAGGQDVWHCHTHVVPRYPGDGPHGDFELIDADERRAYAARLRAHFAGTATD